MATIPDIYLPPPNFDPYHIDSFCFEKVQQSLQNKIGVTNLAIVKNTIREVELKLTTNQTKGFSPEIYIQLGHWNLMIREFGKSISAYQKYIVTMKIAQPDVKILYGLGVAYISINHLAEAKENFEKILEVDPGSSKKQDIYYQLGKLLKLQGHYDQSIEYFCHILSLPELREQGLFHLAHIYILKKSYYEAIHILKGLHTSNLSFETHMASALMLDWLQLHYFPAAPKSDLKLVTPIVHQNFPNSQSGFVNYLYGRYYAQMTDTVKAFNAYKQAFESKCCSPLIWCSIGILYHQQQQAFDALQAYICSLQLDPACTPSWINLGLLYEAVVQNVDALLCYKNAVKYFNETPSLLHSLNILTLQNKIQFLQSLSFSESNHLTAQTNNKHLPPLKLSWSLPVPIEHIHKVRTDVDPPILSSDDLTGISHDSAKSDSSNSKTVTPTVDNPIQEATLNPTCSNISSSSNNNNNNNSNDNNKMDTENCIPTKMTTS